MVVQLEKEGKEDQDIYDAMKCWCETNDKAKARSVEEAQSRISDLESMVQQYSEVASRLSTEIGTAEKVVSDNSKSLGEATELRKQELAKFNQEQKEMTVTISNLKG